MLSLTRYIPHIIGHLPKMPTVPHARIKPGMINQPSASITGTGIAASVLSIGIGHRILKLNKNNVRKLDYFMRPTTAPQNPRDIERLQKVIIVNRAVGSVFIGTGLYFAYRNLSK